MAKSGNHLGARLAIALPLISAGAAHFVENDFLTKLMPGNVKDPASREQMNTSLGALQLAAGITLLFPPLRLLARFLNLAVLVPSFMVALNQIREPRRLEAAGIPPIAALWRLPAQLAIIGAVWRATAKPEPNE